MHLHQPSLRSLRILGRGTPCVRLPAAFHSRSSFYSYRRSVSCPAPALSEAMRGGHKRARTSARARQAEAAGAAGGQRAVGMPRGASAPSAPLLRRSAPPRVGAEVRHPGPAARDDAPLVRLPGCRSSVGCERSETGAVTPCRRGHCAVCGGRGDHRGAQYRREMVEESELAGFESFQASAPGRIRGDFPMPGLREERTRSLDHWRQRQRPAPRAALG